MKNLVTGASGFIGSHIAEALKKRGEEVIALVRTTSKVDFLKEIGVELRYGELNDPDSLKEALKGIDRIYHSAALADEWISPEVAHKINVEGTRNLLEAARQQNVGRVVYVSSLAVLGMHDHHGTPADSPYQKSGDPYIDSKIDSEQLARDYNRGYGLPVTVVRPGFVFGPRDNKFIPRVLEKIKENRFMFVGSGKNKINAVYIENLTDAILRAGDSDKAMGQVYNVTNDSGMDIQTFIYKVSDVWGIDRPVKHIPKAVAFFMCHLLEGWARMTHSDKPPYITKTRIKLLTLNLDFDIDKTRKELGYDPSINIEDGLKRTRNWMDAR
jgi:nucleoside-diphosphate-sugar epimerase